MQVELVRVLETKSFVRVGGNKEIMSDFRVICATNRDLKNMVEQGLFREDLYYRLNVVTIHVPPLRDRVNDIPLLIDYFIRKYCASMNKPLLTIDEAAIRRMESYPFPGNIRELENMVERAIVVGNGKKITVRDLPFAKDVADSSVESLEEFEKKFIQQILVKYNWNISRASKALQVDRVTLYNKIKKYNLKSEE
jgi:DNA-binding NtrC family response regulator